MAFSNQELKNLACAGLQYEIQRLQNQLALLQGTSTIKPTKAPGKPGRPPMSAKAKKEASIRMKAIWAKRRAGKK